MSFTDLGDSYRCFLEQKRRRMCDEVVRRRIPWFVRVQCSCIRLPIEVHLVRKSTIATNIDRQHLPL